MGSARSMLLPLLLSASLAACGSTGADGVGVVRGEEVASGPSEPRWTRGRSAIGTWRVRWRTEPAAIPVNEPFRMLVEIDPTMSAGATPAAVGLALDAGMPSHGHGMVRVPRVVRTSPGRFTAEGVLLHMPGPWELFLDIELRGISERAQFSVEVD